MIDRGIVKTGRDDARNNRVRYTEPDVLPEINFEEVSGVGFDSSTENRSSFIQFWIILYRRTGAQPLLHGRTFVTNGRMFFGPKFIPESFSQSHSHRQQAACAFSMDNGRGAGGGEGCFVDLGVCSPRDACAAPGESEGR